VVKSRRAGSLVVKYVQWHWSKISEIINLILHACEKSLNFQALIDDPGDAITRSHEVGCGPIYIVSSPIYELEIVIAEIPGGNDNVLVAVAGP
jgi:hypothetical protein